MNIGTDYKNLTPEKADQLRADVIHMSPGDVIQNLVVEHEHPRLREADMARVLAKHGANMYAACYGVSSNGYNTPCISLTAAMSRILEPIQGSSLNGLQRMMRHYGIATQNEIENGIFASPVSMFFTVPGASSIFPEFLNQTLLAFAQTEDDLRDLVIGTIYTPTGDYRQPKIDTTSLATGMQPVGPRGSFPEVTLDLTSNAATVGKRGVSISTSYEALIQFKTSIQVLTAALKLIYTQNINDLSGSIYSALINCGATAEPKITINPLETAGDGLIKYRTWLLATGKRNGYKFDTALCKLAELVSIAEMQRAGTDYIQLNSLFEKKAAVLGEGIRLRKQPWVPVNLVEYTQAAAGTLVLCDSRFALWRFKCLGLTLQETERVINQQFERIVISDSDAFSVFTKDAVRIITGV